MLKCFAAATLALAVAASAWAGAAEDKALQDAALALDIEGVKVALRKGANPNASVGNQGTALGKVATANLLGVSNPSPGQIKAGFVDREIVRAKTVEIARLLFVGGAKLGPNDKDILYAPISKGNVDLVALLIDRGASVTADLEGYTPTELSKKYDQDAVYELLVSRGGLPVDGRSSAQLTLIEAAGNWDIERMAQALKDGARINDPAKNKKETALVAAVQLPAPGLGEAAAIWWLLDHGADPNRLDGDGDLPLHRFMRVSKYMVERPDTKLLAEETLKRLLKAGAKVSGVDSTGRTPLHAAARYDNVWAAEILIKEGAKVMPRDAKVKTPLDYAESAPMIKLLKQNGATER